MQLCIDQVQKFIAGFHFLELAGEGGSSGNGVLLLDAPHHHTHVPRLNHYRCPLRLQGSLDAVQNLVGQALLHL